VTQQAVLTEPNNPQGGRLTSVHLSPDQRILAVAAWNAVRFWDITDPRHPVTIATTSVDKHEEVRPTDHGHYVVDHVPEFPSIATRLWDVTDPRHPVVVFTSPTERTEAAAITNKIFVTQESRMDVYLIRLWDITDPNHPVAVDTVEAEATAFTLNADSHRLVIATKGKITLLGITDPRNPTVESVISTASDAESLNLSPDGRTLVAYYTGQSSGNDTIDLWNVADPRKPQRLANAPGVNSFSSLALSRLAFSPDSRTLAIPAPGAGAFNVRLLDLDIDRLTRYLCSTGTTITPSQWEQHIPDQPYQSPCS
jgi:hypothetical protein